MERPGGKPQVLEDGSGGGGAEDDGDDSAGAPAAWASEDERARVAPEGAITARPIEGRLREFAFLRPRRSELRFVRWSRRTEELPRVIEGIDGRLG